MLPPLEDLPDAGELEAFIREFAAETGAVTEEFQDAAARYAGRFLESLELEGDLEELRDHAEAIIQLLEKHHHRIAEEAEECIDPIRARLEEADTDNPLDVILTDEIRSAI